MRIADYEDYLYRLSLKGLKEEVKEFDKSNKPQGRMILKVIAHKLPMSRSNSKPLTTAYDRQKAETRQYQDRTEDYYLIRP